MFLTWWPIPAGSHLDLLLQAENRLILVFEEHIVGFFFYLFTCLFVLREMFDLAWDQGQIEKNERNYVLRDKNSVN